MKPGAHEADLAIETGAVAGAALCGASVVLQAHWWAVNSWPVAVWTLGLSVLFGLGSSTTRRGHAGSGLCRNGDCRFPDIFPR